MKLVYFPSKTRNQKYYLGVFIKLGNSLFVRETHHWSFYWHISKDTLLIREGKGPIDGHYVETDKFKFLILNFLLSWWSLVSTSPRSHLLCWGWSCRKIPADPRPHQFLLEILQRLTVKTFSQITKPNCCLYSELFNKT